MKLAVTSSEKNNNFHFDDCSKGVNPGSPEPKHACFCQDFSLFAESVLIVTPPTIFPPETGGRSNLFSTTKQKMMRPNGMQGTAKCSDAMCNNGHFQSSAHFEKHSKQTFANIESFFPCADVRLRTHTRQRWELSEQRGQRL